MASAVAVPVGLYLLLVWLIFTPLTETPVIRVAHLVGGAAVVLLLPLTTAWWSATVVVVLVAAVTSLLVAVTLARAHASAASL